MDERVRDLSVRLAAGGGVTLTDDERVLIVGSLRALMEAERRIAVQERLLESFGRDRGALMRLMSIEGEVRFGGGDIDPAAHERARDSLRERVARAESGAEWIGAVLDFVRVVAL